MVARSTFVSTPPVICSVITDASILVAFLPQPREHHNDLHFMLDGHLPELKACLFGWALRRDVLLLSSRTETPEIVANQ